MSPELSPQRNCSPARLLRSVAFVIDIPSAQPEVSLVHNIYGYELPQRLSHACAGSRVDSLQQWGRAERLRPHASIARLARLCLGWTAKGRCR